MIHLKNSLFFWFQPGRQWRTLLDVCPVWLYARPPGPVLPAWIFLLETRRMMQAPLWVFVHFCVFWSVISYYFDIICLWCMMQGGGATVFVPLVEFPGPGVVEASLGSLLDESTQKKLLGQKITPPPSPLLSELLKKGSLLPTSPRLVRISPQIFDMFKCRMYIYIQRHKYILKAWLRS